MCPGHTSSSASPRYPISHHWGSSLHMASRYMIPLVRRESVAMSRWRRFGGQFG
jgi:hypothetical protein